MAGIKLHFSHIPAQITSSINCVICPYKSVHVFFPSCCNVPFVSLLLLLQVKPKGAVQRRHLQRLQLPEEHQGLEASAGLLDGIHQLHSGSHLHRYICVANACGEEYKVSAVVLIYSGSLAFSFLFVASEMPRNPRYCMSQIP